MAALSFYSNWPKSSHHYDTTIIPPPPPELLPYHHHDDSLITLSDDHTSNSNSTTNYQHFSTTTNLPLPKRIKYPVLSSTYNPPITTPQLPSSPTFPLPELTQPPLLFTHDQYDSNPVVPDQCYYGDFMMNPLNPEWNPEYYSYLSYPVVPDVCYMDQVQPELPLLPETYDGGGSSCVMAPSTCGINVIQDEEQINSGGGQGKISSQSMAARVRRRKISEKTSELGKLVPGGHRMTTAEMFQAAFKYIKFLQAQVGVLQLMQSSPAEVGAELHALVTSPSIQEKLYVAGRCIATQEVEENLS